MKTLIKFVIAAAIINGAARVAMAEANFYQLKDQSQQLVTFGATAPLPDLQSQIFMKAQELRLPLTSDDIVVQREGPRTIAKASYTQPVEIFPNYIYPMQFDFSVDAVSLAGLGPTNPTRR